MDYFHSVRLDREKCKGCVNVLSVALWRRFVFAMVKPEIMEDRCIDCGE